MKNKIPQRTSHKAPKAPHKASHKAPTIKVSARINGRVSSIALKAPLAALYCTLQAPNPQKPYDFLLDTINSLLNKWPRDDAKGFSTFVQEHLINTIVQEQELGDVYEPILKRLTHCK